MKLTAAYVAQLTLPPGKSDHVVFDDDLIGWGIRLRSRAKTTWIFQYRFGKRSRRMTLGTVAALSASSARKAAETLYSKVKLGEDPAATKKAKAATALAETFGDGVAIYLKRQGERLRARSLVEVTRHLNVHAKPLHRLPLAEIDRRTISKLLSHLADSSGPTASNRTASSIAALYGFLIREGWCDNNPAALTNKRAETPRSRVLSDNELRRIWTATTGTAQYDSIVRLLLLTGLRREEVGGLMWSEIDFDSATITLPPERMKTNCEHLVPLSGPVIEILKAQPDRGREHVFGEGAEHGFRGWGACKATLDARTKIEPGWVVHDLRRSFSTRLNGEGIAQPHIVERLLGHSQGGISAVYNKAQYSAEKRRALDMWGERLLAIVEDREPKVIALRA